MKKDNPFPKLQQHWVFYALIFVGGFFGVYTFSVRGGVFSNAQTANVALFAMSLGTGDWHRALYLLIPMSAYFLGAVLSEFLGQRLSDRRLLQWGHTFIAVDILAVIFLGLLPKSAPDQICQVVLNFICSMQFNTFRENEGTPMATIFVTNHIRETGSHLVTGLINKDPEARKLCKVHILMIAMFVLGGICSAVLCRYFDVKAIFGALPVLIYIFIRLIVKTSAQS